MDRAYLPADIHYFRAPKLGLLPLCPFSKPFGGIFFLICEGWQEYFVEEKCLQH